MEEPQTPEQAMIEAVRQCVNGSAHEAVAKGIMEQLAMHGYHVEEFIHPADDFMHAGRLLRRIGYTPEEARKILKIND